eukprot:s564_g9.t1
MSGTCLKGHRLHSFFLSVLSASCRTSARCMSCSYPQTPFSGLCDECIYLEWCHMVSTASTRHRCVEVELSAARALRCISPHKEGSMFTYFWVKLATGASQLRALPAVRHSMSQAQQTSHALEDLGVDTLKVAMLLWWLARLS